MSDVKFSCLMFANPECEAIPYPRGRRYLCGDCGAEHFDIEAATYREEQRKQMRKLTETLNKSDRFTQRYIKGEPQ